MAYLLYLGCPPQTAYDLQLRTGMILSLLRVMVVNQSLEEHRARQAVKTAFNEHLKKGQHYEVV